MHSEKSARRIRTPPLKKQKKIIKTIKSHNKTDKFYFKNIHSGEHCEFNMNLCVPSSMTVSAANMTKTITNLINFIVGGECLC